MTSSRGSLVRNLVSELIHFVKRHKMIIFGLFIFTIVGSLAPLGAGKYTIDSILDLFLLYIILAESYDILGGFVGYVNLGITLFYGTGAYVYAILYQVLRWPSAESLLMGALFSAFLGLLVSFPMYRLKGFYFAVATLA